MGYGAWAMGLETWGLGLGLDQNLEPRTSNPEPALPSATLRNSVSDPESQDEPVVVPIEAEIDLHSFQPREVVGVVVEYLSAAHASGLREVRLIHGRGQGVQRALVQRALREHPLVVACWDDAASHLGATFARLID